MKKTLTVNLGGVVFNIDEDAYHMLDEYLSNLRIHFRKEDTDEIMSDFESRISELLNDRIRSGFNVITIEHVEEVIKRMGKPEEIFSEQEMESVTEPPRNETTDSTSTQAKNKRLMRDPDGRILGGVASGLAAYMGIDPTVIRLILILLLFLPLTMPVVLIYLILWLVLPVASTAADKLIMRGQEVTPENIGKVITDNFEKIANKTNDYINSGKPRTALQKIGDFIVDLFGVFLKVGTVLLAIILFPIALLLLFVLFVVIIALIAGGGSVIWYSIPFIGDNVELFETIPNNITVLGSISGILLLGIPVVALIYTVCGRILKLKPMPNGARSVLLILWIISLITTCYIAIIYGSGFNISNYYIDKIYLNWIY